MAHVTKRELDELPTTSDLWNGFANRFNWIVVRRRAAVPFPSPMPDDDVAALAKELACVVKYAHDEHGYEAELRMSNSAADHWTQIYPELTRDFPGILARRSCSDEALVPPYGPLLHRAGSGHHSPS